MGLVSKKIVAHVAACPEYIGSVLLSRMDAQGTASYDTAPDASADMKAEKICFYLPALSGGGAELVFVRLSNALVARGVPVQMILNRREGPFSSMLDPGVEVVELGHQVSLRALPSLVRHLRDGRLRHGSRSSPHRQSNSFRCSASRMSTGRIPTRSR